MYRKYALLIAAVITAIQVTAQGPEVTSWIRNTTGATGYAGIPSNIQLVQYSTADVYVSATLHTRLRHRPMGHEPQHTRQYELRVQITRNPVPNTGTPTAVGLGMWVCSAMACLSSTHRMHAATTISGSGTRTPITSRGRALITAWATLRPAANTTTM